MTIFLRSLFAFYFVFLSTTVLSEEFQKPEFPKTKIMVLGTYHMSNPGLDAFNLEADNVLTEKRQAEIQQLVAELARFQPTKIAIESRYSSETSREEYKAFLNGDYELEANETDQIGYRLAKIMGHQDIFPVDFWTDMELDEERYGKEFQDTHAAMADYGEKYTGLMAGKLAELTVGNYLKFMNSDEMIKANHFFYSTFLMKNSEGDWFPGPEIVANWYRRNLLITHNILRAAAPDGSDRILVIFGQGHAYLLKQFLNESPYFEVVEVADYLPE